MTVPHYINEDESDIRAIKHGWYGVETNGKLSSGPFSSQEECLTGIARSSSEFRVSPVRAIAWWAGPDKRTGHQLRVSS